VGASARSSEPADCSLDLGSVTLYNCFKTLSLPAVTTVTISGVSSSKEQSVLAGAQAVGVFWSRGTDFVVLNSLVVCL
jgi:hypothetical protein